MKSSFASHHALLFRCWGTSLFCLCVATGTCKGQSSERAASGPTLRATAIYKQGLADLQKRDLDSARAAFEKVVRLAPQSPEGHNSLGWVLLAEDEVDAAIKQFQIALKLKPDLVEARINSAKEICLEPCASRKKPRV